MSRFVHLHVHSHYSLLDGLGKIPELVSRAKELGMDALAITDHGAMYGAIEFYQECNKQGIKPIIGMEAYIAQNRMTDKRPRVDEHSFHLTLLAQNLEGYKNLIAITTAAHLEGFYYKPRVDKEFLRKHSAGIIALSGCLNGEICRALQGGENEKAERLFAEYRDIFGAENFYIEVQDHAEMAEQQERNTQLVALARKTNTPLVATKDCHYIHPEDAEAQDILLAIQTGKHTTDPTRLSMLGVDYSLTSPDEMAAAFPELPEAVENTVKISERCDLTLELGKWNFPPVEIPEGKTAAEILRELAHAGLRTRYGRNPSEESVKRLEYELGIIETKGYAPYFLAVADTINWAKEQGIITTTRGSAAGSLVSYSIGITTVDPLFFKLPFERFLNPFRPSPPDVDMDYADNRRDEVIAYVTEKYGRDRVAQICTFGTMLARAAVRDVARALGLPYAAGDRIAKLIPMGSQGFPMTLARALEQTPELRDLRDSDPDARRVLDLAARIEGCVRHVSVHAAGVVIGPKPLTEYTPLQRDPGGESLITQYEMYSVEAAGLLKMDFLGIRNLSILGRAVEIARATKGAEVNLERLPLDDQTTFDLLARGDTVGLFQLGGSGMTRYLVELRPSSIHDIMAMVALYRPGPIESIPEFIRRKHNPKLVRVLDPRMKPILEQSYGIITYQDDVLLIAIELAGYTWEEADKLRKAIGKKIPKEMAAQKEKFTKGCVTGGMPEEKAMELWSKIETFAAYGFNKCLSGDTTIVDPETGVRRRVDELYKSRDPLRILSLDSRGAIVITSARWLRKNGEKLVWTLRTRSGREVTITANHPVLTATGWREVKELCLGDRIAVPRRISGPRHTVSIERHVLVALGYLLSEGNLCHPHGVYFYSTAEDELNEFIGSASAFDNTHIKVNRSKSAASVYVGKKQKNQPNGLRQWLRDAGLLGKRATEKYFPEIVDRLCEDDLAIFLGKLWQGDGCVWPKRDGMIFYATSSKRMAHDLQHSLLRLGILSVVCSKKFRYRGGMRDGYTVNISRFNNIARFAETVGKHLIGKKRDDLCGLVATNPICSGRLSTHAARGSTDSVPCEIAFPAMAEARALTSLTHASLAASVGLAPRLFFADKRKRGFLRETLAVLAERLPSSRLKEIANSDVFWDEVKSVEPAGIRMTYDLTVPDGENFIANDIFVHNSHAASYGMVAYQTAYMKANFPAEYMTAVLSAESGNLDKIAEAVAECKKMGIEVLPPDVNDSRQDFTMVDDTHIRFGLNVIKNLGTDVIEVMIRERKERGPFRDLGDFLSRVVTRSFNKKSLEALVMSGAMDSMGERNALLQSVEELLAASREVSARRASGQSSLFGGGSAAVSVRLRSAVPATKREKLAWEKELLGLYVTDHPFAEIRRQIEGRVSPLSTLSSTPKGTVVISGGVIAIAKTVTTKAGERMAFITLTDESATVETVVFPKLFAQCAADIREDACVLVLGKRSEKDDEVRYIADRIVVVTPETAQSALASLHAVEPAADPDRGITIEVPGALDEHLSRELKEIFTSAPGPHRVYLRIGAGVGARMIETQFRINWSQDVQSKIAGVFSAVPDFRKGA